MKYVPNIVGGLLGFAFTAFGAMYFLGVKPEGPTPAPGSAEDLFMKAFAPSAYLAFVKACELIGGILTAIPLTRNWGLLLLGPLIANILVYNATIGSQGVMNPVLIIIALLGAYLLFAERKKFLGLLNR